MMAIRNCPHCNSVMSLSKPLPKLGLLKMRMFNISYSYSHSRKAVCAN